MNEEEDSSRPVRSNVKNCFDYRTPSQESIDDSVPAAMAPKNYGSADGDEPPKVQHASMFKGES